MSPLLDTLGRPLRNLRLRSDLLVMKRQVTVAAYLRCVDDGALAETTMALAARMAAMPARALAATRQLLDEAGRMGLSAALGQEARVQGEMSRAGDFAEGVAAFLQKRPPLFRDR